MKTKAAAQVSDLRKAYPELAPDRDYPPLKFKSLKGKVSAAEWEARVDCACAYRLVRHFGMDDLIYNHISARLPLAAAGDERRRPDPAAAARRDRKDPLHVQAGYASTVRIAGVAGDAAAR